ncbi:hypothetical protein FHT21_000702 [Pedobacter sp. SG908]|nr:hypothetical protein [Pedobacter sp. SG908]NMN35661.1 hypothetical protein [Pedobacter sp. SG918]
MILILKYTYLQAIKAKYGFNQDSYLRYYLSVWFSFSIFFNLLSIENR